jgi:hypothetical protein
MSRIGLRELNPTGSLTITGSLDVYGQTILYQTAVNQSALIVSGAIDIVQAQINAQVQKAKITIENLGTIGDRDSNNSIDLGGFF